MLDVSADQGKFRRCIRLVIADRQPIVLQGLKSVFAAQHDFEIVASCSLGTSCLEAIRNWAPDVALLADTLPDLTASEILAIATAENLPTRLVCLVERRRFSARPVTLLFRELALCVSERGLTLSNHRCNS